MIIYVVVENFIVMNELKCISLVKAFKYEDEAIEYIKILNEEKNEYVKNTFEIKEVCLENSSTL